MQISSKIEHCLRILLVEDNKDDAGLFQKSLRSVPARVTHLTSAASAVRRLSETRTLPDIIVVGVQDVGMISEEFLDWAETEPAMEKIPIYIYTRSPIIDAGLKKRVRGAFLKKDNPAEIRSMVQEMSSYWDRNGLTNGGHR